MLKHSRLLILGLISLVFLLSGCWLRPYKMGIMQGNKLIQSKLERVEPGMTREQVEFLLGEPVVANPFQKNRWDYLYLWQPGYGEPAQRLVTIHFSEEGRVTRIEGDLDRTVVEEKAEAEMELELPDLPDLPEEEEPEPLPEPPGLPGEA